MQHILSGNFAGQRRSPIHCSNILMLLLAGLKVSSQHNTLLSRWVWVCVWCGKHRKHIVDCRNPAALPDVPLFARHVPQTGTLDMLILTHLPSSPRTSEHPYYYWNAVAIRKGAVPPLFRWHFSQPVVESFLAHVRLMAPSTSFPKASFI